VWLDSFRGINLGDLVVQLRSLLTTPAKVLKPVYYNGSAEVSQTAGFRIQGATILVYLEFEICHLQLPPCGAWAGGRK
jgi:hypothetical protein